MYIKSVNQNVKDVFLGKGWENHVRMAKQGDKFLRTSGIFITGDVTSKINDRIRQMEIATAKRAVGITK